MKTTCYVLAILSLLGCFGGKDYGWTFVVSALISAFLFFILGYILQLLEYLKTEVGYIGQKVSKFKDN